DVEGRRPAVTALHDHAVAVAGLSVAGRAVDPIALLAAREQVGGDRQRRRLHGLAVRLAGVEDRVFLEVAARDGAFDERRGRAPVAEEVGERVRLVARLVVHVLAAGRHGTREQRGHDEAPALHGSTSYTPLTAGSPSRNWRVSARSNLGSVASMQMKN